MSNLIFKDLATDKKHEIQIGVIDVEVSTPDGKPCAGMQYELTLAPAGGTRKGTLNAAGRLVESNIPQGAKGELRVIGAPLIALAE